MDIVPVAFLLAGSALLGLAFTRGREAARRRRALARLPSRVTEAELEARIGANVSIEGVLVDGEVATQFPGAARAIEEPHARATTAVPPMPLRLQIGERTLTLLLPVQVVVGSTERTSNDQASLRTLRAGDSVCAMGKLARASADESEAGYRDRAVRYELHPAPEAGWEGHPVALYATQGGPRPRMSIAVLALAVSALGMGAFLGWPRYAKVRIPPAPIVAPTSFARPACAGEVDRLLGRSDPWKARVLAKSCDDAQGVAEASWMLGEVDDATHAFTTLRERDPAHVVSIAEVESAMMSDLALGSRLVTQMKTQWYKGPRDNAQFQLDCIVERVDNIVAGHPMWSDLCLSGHVETTFQRAHGTDCGHFLPAYSIHDPNVYARFAGLGTESRTRCGSSYTALNEAAGAVCDANAASFRILHDAVTGEASEYEAEALLTDRLLDAMPSLANAHLSPSDDQGSQQELIVSRDQLRYDAERDLAVTVTAAWLAHDDARVKRYLPRSEAHARSIMEEHLRLVAGTDKSPVPSHSPSDYGGIDMELFANVDTTAPDVFAQKLVDLRFTSPARLAAFLTTRPLHRDAVRRKLADGFPQVCKACGYYELLGSAFRRRFAAWVVGDREVEAEWLKVTRRLGANLRKQNNYGPTLSLESLLAQ